MKIQKSLILQSAILCFSFFAFEKSAQAQSFTVRTTAYTHSEADHLIYGKSTASGTQLRAEKKYTSAAADWSRFPLGTTFRIKGDSTIYVVDDYGIALVGTSTIDIYRPSKEAMDRWGVREVQIEILKVGDIERSRKILKSRSNFGFVKSMHQSMTRR